MRWYSVDEIFLMFLRNYEKRIPYVDYGDDKFKPFFGALFEIGDLVYITQVSHPQARHNRMKDNVDFIKLYEGHKLMAVVNLNYMFPVLKSKLTEVNYKDIEDFRRFKSIQQKNNYIALLKKELRQKKYKQVDKKAEDLYRRKHEYPEDKVSIRCFEYKELEQKCIEFTSR